MKAKPLPDQTILLACFNYDPLTGDLIWKHRPEWTFSPQIGRKPSHIANAWNVAWAGKPALASPAKNGYLRGAFNGETLYAHRVIYKLVYNQEPDDIDHEDGVRFNNRILNLIDKSREGNLKNRALSKNNTSGTHGVSWSNTHKLWVAVIYHLKKSIHLGWFKEKTDAIAARKAAEKLYGYHSNHGRSA